MRQGVCPAAQCLIKYKMREIKLEIDILLDGKTVGELLKNRLCVSSRQLTALKKSGGILLDGMNVTVRAKVSAGQVLKICFEDEKPSENVVPVNIPLDILYEDDDILVVAKPKDMPIHPSAYNYDNTLGNACMYYYRGTNFVFRPITRLDRDTTGVVIIAKNKLSATRLSEQMQNGGIKKTYLALLSQTPNNECGTVNAPIGRCDGSVIKRCVRDDGKEALTEYCVREVRPVARYAPSKNNKTFHF